MIITDEQIEKWTEEFRAKNGAVTLYGVARYCFQRAGVTIRYGDDPVVTERWDGEFIHRKLVFKNPSRTKKEKARRVALALR